MHPQPENPRTFFADTFKDRRVVEAYRHRPPYPQEVFEILTTLLTDEPRTVLDVGSGSGDLARPLVTLARRVDAVDFSSPMIERGRQLPGGDSPRLQWIYGKVEEVQLAPPYALITAGSSIHWLEWEKSFPLFRRILTPAGSLALVYRKTLPMPWDADMRELRVRFLPRGGHSPAHVAQELEARGFFHKQGERATTSVPFFQSVEDFIECLHSHFSQEYLDPQSAAGFDQQMHSLLLHHHPDGILPLHVMGLVIWGRPATGVNPEQVE
ncbi:MAG: class I SAM-dependent methyltransferase [Chloroflexi bacterium]|nr:class I SAM-dependent methyltransferase [Chloroflexota bacterium]